MSTEFITAAVIDASSEVLPECTAANVLDDDLSTLWLSGPGMPQVLTLVVSKGVSAITQVGLRCWHTYTTNPKELAISSSVDGLNFRERASVECELTDRLQIIPLGGSRSAGERFVRITIWSTHGGERTYLNRLLLRTDAAPLVAADDAVFLVPRLPDSVHVDFLDKQRARQPEQQRTGDPFVHAASPLRSTAPETPPRQNAQQSAAGLRTQAMETGRGLGAQQPPSRLWTSPERILNESATGGARLLAAVHARRARLSALLASATQELLSTADLEARGALRQGVTLCTRRLRSVEACARDIEDELLGRGGDAAATFRRASAAGATHGVSPSEVLVGSPSWSADQNQSPPSHGLALTGRRLPAGTLPLRHLALGGALSRNSSARVLQDADAAEEIERLVHEVEAKLQRKAQILQRRRQPARR